MIRKKIIKKILSASIASLLVLQIAYFSIEPTLSLALTESDSVVVTLNVDSGVTISNGAAASMLPSIGISANKSVGGSSWSVATNSNTGYTLAVKASATPALVSGSNSFADYTATTPATPETWVVDSGNKEFGFSAYGTDVLDGTWGTQGDCGNTSTGVVPTGSKYRGFSGTTDITIATHSGVTPTTGVTTNICFAAEQYNVYAPSGTYTATITATATAS